MLIRAFNPPQSPQHISRPAAPRRDHQPRGTGVPCATSEPGPPRRCPHHRALRPRPRHLDRQGVHFLTAHVAGV